MRKLQRPKLYRHLILSAAIIGIIVTPAAFAHGHHSGGYAGNSSSRSTGHSGFGRHSFASADSRTNAHSDNQSFAGTDQNQSVASASNPRKHERVPDEEELQQPER